MLNLNDIISYGNAKFQLVKLATSKDIERILEKLNAIKIIRKNNTLYSVNDVVFTEKIYSGLFLQCTVAGTSGNNELNLTNKKDGDTITDGTVIWTLHSLLNKGSSINVGEVSNVTVTPNFGKVSLTWEDPSDLAVSGVTIARWAGTRIIRKVGSAPTNKNDGELVLESLVKNQYQNSVFEDTGLEDGVTYYYGFFPYTYDGIFSPCSENYYATVPVRPKATLTLDKNTLTYSIVGDTITITATTNSSGAITAVSSDTTKATVGVQGTVITVSCLSVGEATITISQAADSSYQSPDSITLNYSGYNDCGLTLSKDTITLDASNLTDTITITRTGDGVISAVSSDTSIATVSLSGTTITVTAVATGNVTVTVSVAAGTNWLAPTDATASVAVQLFPATLNDADWDLISQEAIAGTAGDHWDVGDVKMIELNGKIGDYFTADHLSIGVFILDINHPMNGTAENNIIFGCFKSALSNGEDLCLDDSKYGSYVTNGSICFNMSHTTTATSGDNLWGYNYGGWKGSDLRYDILGATSTPPSQYNTDKNTSNVGYDATASTLSSPKADTFLAALPSDLRGKLRLWTRWVDAVGKSTSDSAIQATVDAVTLLAECEIFASRMYSNSYEFNHNTRMAYYSAGNATSKKNVSDGTTFSRWWECSPYYARSADFCCSEGNYTDSRSRAAAKHASGLAPAFKV